MASAWNLIIVVRWMIRRPRLRRPAPVSKTTALQPELRPIIRWNVHGLAGKIERNKLLQKPVTVWPNDVKTGAMCRWKPGPIDHATDPREILRRAAGAYERRVYDVRHREAIVDEDYETLPGRTTFERVRRLSTPIGRQGGHTLVAPLSGQLFMPNRQPIKRPGDDAYFIVRELSPGWLNLSARLRRSAWMDTWTPRLLPGVRRRPGHEHELLVAPDIAVVLKRQLLHLLGYRLMRHTPVPHLSRPIRLLCALRALWRALGRMTLGLLRGGERAALPAQREEDWIIARRTLDREPPVR